MHRFHDSRFHSVRLVCRLRRGPAASTSTPASPATASASESTSTTALPSSHPETNAANETVPDQQEEFAEEAQDESNEVAPSEDTEQPALDGSRRSLDSGADRYFIVKSLTLQDLESSVVTGIWATQAHNEETFNKAFEVSIFRSSFPRPCVYLIRTCTALLLACVVTVSGVIFEFSDRTCCCATRCYSVAS